MAAEGLFSDDGPEPYVVDIEEATMANDNFRTTLWTGAHLQMTVMSIPVGGEVGLERHGSRDQFLRIESGRAHVRMGQARDDLPFDREVEDDWVIMVPAGSWHNITNAGDEPLKLYRSTPRLNTPGKPCTRPRPTPTPPSNSRDGTRSSATTPSTAPGRSEGGPRFLRR